jgi:ferredoxin
MNLNQPHVDLELCIGCGLCEAKCPILGQPAIYVTSMVNRDPRKINYCCHKRLSLRDRINS